MKYVAFVCGHNKGRSQMAMAMFNFLKKQYPRMADKYEAISWGTDIKEGMNQRVVEVMSEFGVNMRDVSVYFSKGINHPSIQDKLSDVALVYTMGCMDEACVLPDGLRVTEDWGLEDPVNEDVDVAVLRDKTQEKVLELLESIDYEVLLGNVYGSISAK